MSATAAASPGTASTAIGATVSVAEAARLLGRDLTRVYALIRSGDLVAVPATEDAAGPLRVDRTSLERWLAASSTGGAPLSARNAWALIALASGEQAFSSDVWDCSSGPRTFPARARG
jgi:hypothetical protein